MKQQSLALLITAFTVLTQLACSTPPKNNLADTPPKKRIDSLTTAPLHNSFLKMDTLHQLPAGFQSLINGKIITVFRVDFTGDGRQDFICRSELPVPNDTFNYMESWITADKKILSSAPEPEAEIDYSYFVNLDNDPEPEIVKADGYEDGVDYYILDQDLKTGNRFVLFYFSPVIIENGKNYWGYAWDMQDLIIKKDSGKIYLKASLDNDIKREENIIYPKPPGKFPAIFFTGHSTQPFNPGPVHKIKWMTLDELKKGSRQ